MPGRPQWPLPPEEQLSERAREIAALIDTLVDGPGEDSTEHHGQRIIDLRLLWDRAERGLERALWRAADANPASKNGLSVRGIASLLGINPSTVQFRIGKGREQQARRRARRTAASTTS